MQARDLGERGLLARLQRFCPAAIVGDDAAVVPAPEPGKSLVVTADVLVDGVHFSDRTTSPEDAGWRAAAANLSDLAATGAMPLGITVGLSLPGETSVARVEGMYRGMVDCLRPWNVEIVGGDVVRSPVLSLAITAFGQVDPRFALRRCNALPGDAILVTGYHGDSRAGLECLLNPDRGTHLSEPDRTFLYKAHQRPQPRLDVLPLLERQDRGRAIAGMDTSDGLADAVVQICEASGVGAKIACDRLPISPALQRMVLLEKAWEWAFYGGEDFELVLCLPREMALEWIVRLGNDAAIVGEIVAGDRVTCWRGDRWLATLDRDRSFQHFDVPQ